MSDDSSKRVYGIDLGTTYSAISFVNEYGKPEIITNSDNERVTPSVVYFETLDNVVVGTTAKNSGGAEPDRVVDFVKRQMSSNVWSFELDGHNFTPEVISSYILKRLASDAEKNGGHQVKDVVITCPAYFGDLERKRTRQAGEIAGLNVLEILDEPVAAAINYGLNEEAKGKNIIVYDLGGGTFDVTVVRIGNELDKNEIKIVCTEGDHQLGGKDWDDAIFAYYESQFHQETGCDSDLKEDAETVYDLRIGCEKDKKTLTSRESVKRRISFEQEQAVIVLTRETFNELTQGLLERTIELTNRVLEEAAKQGITQIDAFLLVGGSTRMPQIAAKIEEVFTPRLGVHTVSFDVDEAVAKGAAQVGNIKSIQKEVEDSGASLEEIAAHRGITVDEAKSAAETVIQRVATKSYGLEALKGSKVIVRNIITKNSNVPAEGRQIFFTEGATNETDLIVYSNDLSDQDIDLDMGLEIGRAVFTFSQELPPNTPIEVTFHLDDQGTLSMTAVEQKYQQEIKADFKVEGLMTEEEMVKAQEDLRKVRVE